MNLLKGLRKKPLVSVVIPTYKENDYIAASVESLRNQSGRLKVQILIGVNGPDYSWYEKLCDRYKMHKDVEVYYTDTAGISAGRNIGLKHARGEYITFLDDDDLFSEHYLEDALGLFEEKVDIVCMPLMDCTIDGKPLENGGNNYINNALIRQVAKSAYPTALEIPPGVITTIWSKIYRASVLREMTPFREDVLVSEDVIFWAQNSTKVRGLFHCMNMDGARSWYMRRVTPNSLSRVDDDEKFINERINVINELKHIKRGKCDERLVHSFIRSQQRHIDNRMTRKA